MSAKRTAAALCSFLVWGSLAASCMAQASRPAGPGDRAAAAKKLPDGFEPVEGAKLHPSGYPAEIRCKKDGSVLVFVPGGEFTSGLTDEQVAGIALKLEPEPDLPAGEANLPELDKLKPGRLLTQEDLQDIARKDCQQRACVKIIAIIEANGNDIPKEDLDRWRKEGRTLKGLFTLPGFQKALGMKPEDANSFAGFFSQDFDANALAELFLQSPVEAARERREEKRKELRNAFPAARRGRLGPYYIDKCEVTNGQYRKFLAEIKDPNRRPGYRYGLPYNVGGTKDKWFYCLLDDPKRNADDQPVAIVTETDVLSYAAWAGRRLPSADQWRRAALGDGNRLFPWGDDFDANLCKCGGPHPGGPASAPALEALGGSVEKIAAAPRKRDKAMEALRMIPKIPAAYREIRGLVREFRDTLDPAVPAKVGTFPKDLSPFGCCDMAGNVSEWVIAKPARAVRAAELITVGGNADTRDAYQLSPALERSHESPGKLVGFRTVLPLEEPAPQTRPKD